MLHKKSEYRLQYSKLNKELRRKIWQDNIALRKSRLMSNQATHYWEYQLRDEICDCESGEEEQEEGALSPLRQKHKNLLEQYQQQTEKSQVFSVSVQKVAREIAVQTPEWDGGEPGNGVDITSEEKLIRHVNSLKLPELSESQNASPKSLKQPMTPGYRPKTAMSLTRPSRTSRKLHTEGKQTHFVPFGWNEKKTDVGHKQTYNVCAPKKEVHESAMHASFRRKAEIDQFLAHEKNQVKHQNRSRERTSSDTSSQWMSEYQDQFNIKGCKPSSRNCRPLSAPPAPRQPVSWRRS